MKRDDGRFRARFFGGVSQDFHAHGDAFSDRRGKFRMGSIKHVMKQSPMHVFFVKKKREALQGDRVNMAHEDGLESVPRER
ncbi:MAG TPA: hypothetical protein PLB81_11170 [Deltaproteobacteria bacterium]|nr:hypothetical protein [Deltaproteobacteria bacterium]